MTKIVAITGGVYSSLGKGLITSSIGCIFKEIGYTVSVLKLDPYLNVDANTLSPDQHGEVFVTNDGVETDLDLGHYERFLGCELTGSSSVTAGKIYNSLLKKERAGKYEGETVQIVPHVTNEIRDSIKKLLGDDLDLLFIEVGGTVGDIESLSFIETLSKLKLNYGFDNVLFIHISPIVFLETTKELKTKPTQHSIKTLRKLGITPDILILRSQNNLKSCVIDKISQNTSLSPSNIFTSSHQENIYFLPESLYSQKIHRKIEELLNLKNKKGDMSV
ncbi:putative CTP synthase [Rhinoraja longicauda]